MKKYYKKIFYDVDEEVVDVEDFEGVVEEVSRCRGF